MSAGVLRVCALYPDLMNIYADRGNLMMLERRCGWRGIGFELAARGLGEALEPGAHDLFYLGGGQDRDQRACAEDLLATKRDALHEAAARGAIVLGICGGYQLLGRSYELSDGETIGGVELIDAHTVREPGPRLIGNVAIEVQLDGRGDSSSGSSGGGGGSGGADPDEDADARRRPVPQPPRILAGFENHGGRTHLGAGERALGRVVRGHGNDGRSGLEGARRGSVIGTYLHGPLLPKNSWFADWLIATALGIEPWELAPLEDALERRAHEAAIRAAGA
ncbi:MAG: glutamine amidotransferase [Solirubrobacterales bacterium]|nr:glutamine amidotransferase [Solirubrobacterales bacterium]